MRSVTLVMMALLVFPAAANADGIAFTVVGADTEVRATEQRAVMWLRDGEWEIQIQPVFARDAGATTWCNGSEAPATSCLPGPRR